MSSGDKYGRYQKSVKVFAVSGATFMELGIYQLNLVKNAQEIFLQCLESQW